MRFYDRPYGAESPMVYKSADQVREQIERFGPADVVGLVTPNGCVPAGGGGRPWAAKAAAGRAGKAA